MKNKRNMKKILNFLTNLFNRGSKKQKNEDQTEVKSPVIDVVPEVKQEVVTTTQPPVQKPEKVQTAKEIKNGETKKKAVKKTPAKKSDKKPN